MNPFSEFGSAANAAGRMKQRINTAASYFPELAGTPAESAIRKKNIITPYFYSETFAVAGRGLNINQDELGRIAGAIITTDEIVESGALITPDHCLETSLLAAGCPELKQSKPQTYRELRTMFDYMARENYFGMPGVMQANSPGENFANYFEVVRHSFGMMPLFAAIAEDHGEEDFFTDNNNHGLLENVEAASRILADVITLGKDVKHGSPNAVLMYQADCPGETLGTCITGLSSYASWLIRPVRYKLGDMISHGQNVPQHYHFACNFAEVMENVAGVEDMNMRHKDPLLRLMGNGITNLVFPVPGRSPR